MNKELEQDIQNHNKESLQLIFRTYMYADPTLLRYQEELAACGDWLFEPHEERMPEKAPSEWDDTYWKVVMLDLQFNFSKRRFNHVREVAEAVEKEKINAVKEKLAEERRADSVPTAVSVQPEPSVSAQQNRPKTDTRPAAPHPRVTTNPPLPPPAVYREEPREAKARRLQKERNRLILSIVVAAAVLILVIVLVLYNR